MWIAFNKTTSAVLAQLNYGSPARQGITNNFSIFAYFDELDLDDTAFVATISFKRPDGTNVPTTYFMDQVGNENIFHADQASPIGSSPIFFVDGISYPGFVFTPQDPAILSMAGRYEATIKIYYNEQEVTNGTVRFFVENAVYNDTYDISASQWSELLRKFPALSGSGSLLLVTSDDPDSLRGLGLVSGVPVYYTVDNTVRLVAESDGELNIDTIVMYSKAAIEANYALKTGPLPSYSVAATDNVLNFITNNDIGGKAIVIYISGKGCFTCRFTSAGPSGSYVFELESLDSEKRYTSGYTNPVAMGSKTFEGLISDTYRSDYETTNNKVQTLSSSSTVDEYPSAKCVYDEFKQVKDVLDGRVRAFVIDTTKNSLTSGQTYYKLDGTSMTYEEAQEYINAYRIQNSEFQSTATDLELVAYQEDFSILAEDNTIILSDDYGQLKVGYDFFVKGSYLDRRLIRIRHENYQTTLYFQAYDAKTDLSGYSTTAQCDAKYVAKLTSAGVYVYTHDGSTDGEIPCTTSAYANAVVRRNGDGQIVVPATPTDNSHATSKGYVDIAISEASVPGASYDAAPTLASNNLVRSGGIYAAIILYRHNIILNAEKITPGYASYTYKVSIEILNHDLGGINTLAKLKTALDNYKYDSAGNVMMNCSLEITNVGTSAVSYESAILLFDGMNLAIKGVSHNIDETLMTTLSDKPFKIL